MLSRLQLQLIQLLRIVTSTAALGLYVCLTTSATTAVSLVMERALLISGMGLEHSVLRAASAQACLMFAARIHSLLKHSHKNLSIYLNVEGIMLVGSMLKLKALKILSLSLENGPTCVRSCTKNQLKLPPMSQPISINVEDP